MPDVREYRLRWDRAEVTPLDTALEFGARKPGGHDIELQGGGFLNLRDPDPADIRAEDIAHGLSNTCRFAGQCSRFYSVAEHAYRVSARLEQQRQPLDVVIWGHHHDDTEAYIGDVTAPLKGLLGAAYRDIEQRLETAIIGALGLPIPDTDGLVAVKEADYDLLAIEARSFMPSEGKAWWSADRWDGTWLPQGSGEIPPRQWELRWLMVHERLMGRWQERQAHAQL